MIRRISRSSQAKSGALPDTRLQDGDQYQTKGNSYHINQNILLDLSEKKNSINFLQCLIQISTAWILFDILVMAYCGNMIYVWPANQF